MATWTGKPWNTLRGLVTTAGVWMSVYHPGAEGEWVEVLGPSGASQRVDTPGLLDWQLVAYDGKLVVYYNRDAGDGRKDLVAVYTPIVCGGMVGELVAGATGPMGPAGAKGGDGPPGPPGAPGSDGKDAEVDEATMQRIAALTAEAVLLGGPAGDHYGLAPNAQFGTRLQETVAVMFTNQAFWQEVVKAIDEAALGLVAGGYSPKVNQGG
jgi:hypothetical protein